MILDSPPFGDGQFAIDIRREFLFVTSQHLAASLHSNDRSEMNRELDHPELSFPSSS
jgi:hypothetical protein